MISNINVNNISYDWNDIEIHFVGNITGGSFSQVGQGVGTGEGIGVSSYMPSGVSSISYNTDHQIDYDYGREGFAVGRKYGAFRCAASMILDYFELNKLKHKLFSVTQSFKSIDVKILYKTSDGLTHIDTLYGCVLSYPDNLGGNQNEMGLESTIDLNPVWIRYQTI